MRPNPTVAATHHALLDHNMPTSRDWSKHLLMPPSKNCVACWKTASTWWPAHRVGSGPSPHCSSHEKKDALCDRTQYRGGPKATPSLSSQSPYAACKRPRLCG